MGSTACTYHDTLVFSMLQYNDLLNKLTIFWNIQTTGFSNLTFFCVNTLVCLILGLLESLEQLAITSV